MSRRWERWGNEWIKDRFVSGQDNIFITETTETGIRLYWFDDGPEIPTESVEIGKTKVVEVEKRVSELKGQGGQAVCEYLAGFFPDLRKYWLYKYGGV
jgi:hypothetical protein